MQYSVRVRDYGTLCLDCCVIAITLLTLAMLWRHSFSQSTSAYRASGALATMRYTNLRFTYLLNYLLMFCINVLVRNRIYDLGLMHCSAWSFAESLLPADSWLIKIHQASFTVRLHPRQTPLKQLTMLPRSLSQQISRSFWQLFPSLPSTL